MKPALVVISAALVTVVAGAAAITAGQRRLAKDATLTTAASSLRWTGVTVNGTALAPVRPPFAILYVLPSCSHCAPAARAFDVETRARDLRALVVSRSGADAAGDYQRRLRLRSEIAADSGRSFGRSAGIKWVPSLILISSDGIARVFPIPAPVLIGRYLEDLK